MEFAGSSLSSVLTVLGGFAAAVIVLYLLKLRRRQVAVPFVHLWQEVLAEKQTTRLFSALKRLVSLLIALAIVSALAFAMGDPRVSGATDEGRTLLVLIDASASMQATDVAPNRLERAREEAEALIASLGPADRMLIAQMDAATVPLTPLTEDTRTLRDGLERLAPTDLITDWPRALRFARDVLRDRPSPELIIVSDGGLGDEAGAGAELREAGIDARWIRIGEGGPNVAITAFTVRRYPLDKSRSEVLVELWNPGEDAVDVELELFGDGEPIDVTRLRVAAGERLARFFEGISGADRTLEARVRALDTEDILGADDRAYARLPERRRARVQVVTRDNLYLSAALLLDEYLDVVEVEPDAYPADGRFDVTIFDGWLPPSPPTTATLYLNPAPIEGRPSPFEVTGTLNRPFFERVERRHPLVRFMALRDVNVAEALAARPGEGDRVIAGDRRGPLLIAGTREGHPVVGLLFDVRQSDLPLRVAWPIFLLNTVDHFMEEESGFFSSHRLGETWHIPVPGGSEEATLIAPDGTETEVPIIEGRAVCSGAHAGFYTLRVGDQEEVFAANIGQSEESRVDVPETLEIDGQPAAPPELRPAGTRTDLWAFLVLGALFVLSAEWLSYHRRWTV